MACLDSRDASARVPLADIEVHALAHLVSQMPHGRLGHSAQVERLGRRLAPVEEARSQRIPAVLGATDDAQACQLSQQAMGR